MKASDTLQTETILIATPWRRGATVKIYKRGAGDLLAEAELSPAACLLTAQNLLKGCSPSDFEKDGHWVPGHGYHVP